MTEQASNILAGSISAVLPMGRKQTVSLTEAELVRRCQAGQTEAFAELVIQYQDRVFNVIYRMCNRPADAEELTQETFLKAFERLGQFRGGSRFYTWLFRIATNLTISHRRRLRLVKFHSLNGPADDETSAPADVRTAALAARRVPSPEAAAMSRETAEQISGALGELGEEFRVVVVLRDIEDMDYAEISEVLDLPVGTVKSRLHRARGILREKLADLVK